MAGKLCEPLVEHRHHPILDGGSVRVGVAPLGPDLLEGEGQGGSVGPHGGGATPGEGQTQSVKEELDMTQ